jgi:hypothetical protein
MLVMQKWGLWPIDGMSHLTWRCIPVLFTDGEPRYADQETERDVSHLIISKTVRIEMNAIVKIISGPL